MGVFIDIIKTVLNPDASMKAYDDRIAPVRSASEEMLKSTRDLTRNTRRAAAQALRSQRVRQQRGY